MGERAVAAGDPELGLLVPFPLALPFPRLDDGDGDGPLADGRTPVECRAHRVPPERRHRHVARVEPVGRDASTGRGLALRSPFTPRRSLIV